MTDAPGGRWSPTSMTTAEAAGGRMRDGRHRRSWPLAALLVGLATLALAAPALSAGPAPAFSCRASGARVATSSPLPTILLEPVVANAPNAPCATDSKATVAPLALGPVTAAVLSADTTLSATAATASSRVADAGLDLSSPSTVALPLLPPLQLPGLLPVTLGLATLNSTAGYTCQNGQPVATGSSEVVGLSLKALGLSVPINIPNPSQPVDIDLGALLTVHLNQQVVTPTTLTQRALYITSPALGIEVALGESTVDIAGNPCGAAALAGTPTPPTPPLVIPVTITALPGTARLLGVPRPGGLATGPFTARVVGRQIASVRFTLDGKPVPGAGPLSARIASGSLPNGTHALRARVTFTTASKTPARTLGSTFRTRKATANSGNGGMGGAGTGGGAPAPSPRFTG